MKLLNYGFTLETRPNFKHNSAYEVYVSQLEQAHLGIKMATMPPNEPKSGRYSRALSGFFKLGIKTLEKAKTRLRAARWVLMGALVILVFLALSEQISWFETVFFALVLLAAAFFGAPGAEPVMRPHKIIPATTASDQPAQLGKQVPVILDCLPDPCIILDRSKKIEYANQAAKQIYPSIRVGEPISFGLRQPDLLDAITRVLSDGQSTHVSYADRVPHEVFLYADIAPLYAHALGKAETPDEADWLIIALRDRTSEQLAEQMRVDFVANASHELRTPLQALMGFLDTLAGPAKDDEEARAKFIRIMHAQSERMSRLIDDLMSLSHIELNRHVRPTQDVNLVSVINEVIDVASTQAEQADVHIQFDQQTKNAVVVGDRDQLFQVFDNLVQNALKYGASGNKVDITISPAKSKYHKVWVQITDYGAGIASEHVPRLTERFYRVDVETSRQKKGTGLGLAIVKHILVRHRGELAIKSAPGEGTTFTVKI